MNNEKALLSIKYLICSKIDGNWGAGDNHLIALEILQGIDPTDERVKSLYENLKKRSERYDERANNPETRKHREEQSKKLHERFPSIPNYSMEQLKPESVYRDEGKDEAEYYASQIKEKFGEEYLDKLVSLEFDW